MRHLATHGSNYEAAIWKVKAFCSFYDLWMSRYAVLNAPIQAVRLSSM